MIQRIQTLYLLLAAIAVFLMYAFPFAQLDVVEKTYTFDAKGILVEDRNVLDIPFQYLIALLGFASVLGIMLYKKRSAQLKIGRLSQLMHLTVWVVMFFSVDTALEQIPNGEAADVHYEAGFFLPIAALIFILLANRAIRKDEALIRSTERLRG